ncbi:hypothetical protein BGZ65_010417 [Modicella reniformis]|uniref:Uncharacterized protein n=1 Tax=Modicella reniformis TaxID=1440133 RepID=A0A9P6LRG3_9FUNG|nr:hypothetical protein BGZ65_010417 [Modicella reniformis]
MEDVAAAMDLVQDENDKAEIRDMLKISNERIGSITDLETSYIQTFSKSRDEVKEILKRGWYSSSNAESIPDEQFREMERYSLKRLPCERTMDEVTRQNSFKDAIFCCTMHDLELGAMEAAKQDIGPNGTKALSDTRKLSKVLKDMLDMIHARVIVDMSQLATFGLRISGRSVNA